jgi:hypothetical protein
MPLALLGQFSRGASLSHIPTSTTPTRALHMELQALSRRLHDWLCSWTVKATADSSPAKNGAGASPPSGEALTFLYFC